MLPLTAREALDQRVIRVTDTMRPADLAKQEGKVRLYAIFEETDGRFLGIVTGSYCVGFPFRIFADLCREAQSEYVKAECPIEEVFKRIQEVGVEAFLSVMMGANFLAPSVGRVSWKPCYSVNGNSLSN